VLRYSFFFSIIWAITIAVLSLIPGKNLPSVGIDYIDKVGHFVVYAILAFFIYHAAVNAKFKTPILWCIIIPILYGIIMEFLQGYLSEVRHADAYDALFNGLGAIFVGLTMFLRR